MTVEKEKDPWTNNCFTFRKLKFSFPYGKFYEMTRFNQENAAVTRRKI